MPASRKEIALSFLKLASAGNAKEAFQRYVGKGFRHHNAYFKGDPETLSTAMDASAKEFPDKTFDVQRALEDGDLVAVHSRFRLMPSMGEMAIAHIFRFEGDRIVELWDFGQAVPEDCPNENTMF